MALGSTIKIARHSKYTRSSYIACDKPLQCMHSSKKLSLINIPLTGQRNIHNEETYVGRSHFQCFFTCDS